MYRVYYTALVLLLVVCLHSSLSAQSQSDGTKPGNSTVSGRVIFKGNPIRDATVTLLTEQSTDPRDRNKNLGTATVNIGGYQVTGVPARRDLNTSLRARTDQNGNYQITGVPAGRYLIGAYAPGFTSTDDSSDGEPGVALNIGEGENIEKIDLELKRGGVISGRLTDANNRPLVEEGVQLMKLDQNGNPQPVNLDLRYSVLGLGSSDDRGIYRIFGLPEGRYLVSLGISQSAGSTRSYSSNIPRTFHPGVTDQSQAKIIEVREGSETADVDIAVAEEKKAYKINGRVVSAEDGQPVRGVDIAFGLMVQDRRRINGWRSLGILSNANGEFRLEGMLPGKYGLFARSDQENGVFSEIEVCDVRDRDLTGVEIKVRPGGSISGVVAIEGTNDSSVLANATQIQLSFSTRTAELSDPIKNQIRISPAGLFYVRALQPGKVDIRIVNNQATRGFSILRIERNAALVSEQEGIEIGPGEDISNVRVVIGYSPREGNQ
jgi:hypothetical protein